MSKPQKPPKIGLFAGVGAMLADGFTADLQSSEADIVVDLADIEIGAQDRGQDEMETDEQTLADLGKSLRKRQAQAIVIRPNVPGASKPYRLVAGERRVRAALLEGLTTLRARLMTLTDEEAQELMTLENIHRLNLTQLAEARKFKREIDTLGSVQAVLDKYNKSAAWLSKRMALLDLPAQAKRLVTENVSADIEVLNAVRTIEKASPEKAKALVDDLKATKGKGNAREQVAAVKAEVKPSKKQQEAKKAAAKPQERTQGAGGGGTVATPKDRSHESPSAGKVVSAGNIPAIPATAEAAEVLEKAYTNIFEFGANVTLVLETLADGQEEAIGDWLRTFYEAGKQSKDSGRAVMLGLRKGEFATDGGRAFAMVAFLHGADAGAKFNVANILASAKP